MNNKCFNIVQEIIREANNVLQTTFELNRENMKILEQYCDCLDYVYDECGGMEYDVKIDAKYYFVIITMKSIDMVFDRINSNVPELISRTVNMSYYQSEDGYLCTRYVFPSVWEKR